MKARLSMGKFKLITVVGFLLACVVFTAYMYSQAGGYVPGISKDRPHKYSIDMTSIGNVVEFSDVRVAGVPVGKVENIEKRGRKVRVTMRLEDVAAPLHGVPKVQPIETSLTGSWGIEIEDGHGPEIPDGATLPAKSFEEPVTMRDVLADLDEPTRKSLSKTVRSLDMSTSGRSDDISKLMSGMAHLGRNGHTALDAIAAQSNDLKALMKELNTVFHALDTSQGRFADVVGYANQLSKATAGQRESLETAMRDMPGVLSSARNASGDLTELSQSLAPVASNLKDSAPALGTALKQLPAAAKDLRGSLPALNGTMDRAPGTLDRVPRFGSDVRGLIPSGTEVLRDLNPMLRYMKPYGQELAHAVVNFGASFHYKDSSGSSMLRLLPTITAESAKPLPFNVGRLPGVRELGLIQDNAYPKPGTLENQQPFSGKYPRVERDSK